MCLPKVLADIYSRQSITLGFRARIDLGYLRKMHVVHPFTINGLSGINMMNYIGANNDIVKELTGTLTRCLKSKDEAVIMNKKDILKRWEECISELFEDNRGKTSAIKKLMKSSPKLKDDIKKALEDMKNGKAVGPVSHLR